MKYILKLLFEGIVIAVLAAIAVYLVMKYLFGLEIM
jgi:hypothetical protein